MSFLFRVGMMGWALLTINFTLAGAQINDPSSILGAAVNSLLINMQEVKQSMLTLSIQIVLCFRYLLKFFYWETGYFNTLDITLDRAGYYLCWGCLVFVQVWMFKHYFVHLTSQFWFPDLLHVLVLLPGGPAQPVLRVRVRRHLCLWRRVHPAQLRRGQAEGDLQAQ